MRSRQMSAHSRSLTLCVLTVLVALTSGPQARGAESATAPIMLREGLTLLPTGRSGRAAFHTDAVEEQIVRGSWKAPKVGDSIGLPGGTNRIWESAQATPDGWFTNRAMRGGYAYLPYVSDTSKVLLLHALGHSMVYANGEPHAGDIYENGTALFPVQLHPGTNHFLFAAGRGRMKASLESPKAGIFLDHHDTTFPDLIRGERSELWGAVILINATTSKQSGLSIRSQIPGQQAVTTSVGSLLPLSARKVGFRIGFNGRSTTNQLQLALALRGPNTSIATQEERFNLRVRESDQTHRETFVSEVDGTVQYYAVTPAHPIDKDHPAQALVLSTHGASVEAEGQAAAYAPKPWIHLAAATNRRPYGFDWEDWGRKDALEVLGIATRKFHTDPLQTYLTGHSMGGHGSWQLSATYPDRFAAVAPSAGWISFYTYAGGQRDTNTSAIRQLLQRANASSETLEMASNYLHHGIYILHGDADDNVPVEEAREMKKVLEVFHRDFSYYEQPGAGHWWGNACVDWPPIFDLFSRHKIPSDAASRSINFTTVNPGVSSSSHWASIETQKRALKKSVVQIHYEPNARRFTGATENVERLALNTAHTKPGGAYRLELDGQVITNVVTDTRGGKIWLSRESGQWQLAKKASPTLKGPHRSGPFKEAFNHRMLFVYGTHGTADENAWAFSKARLDAEAFWYRGNASVEVISDREFHAAKEKDRGVILYGHSDLNSAWATLLANSPVQVSRGKIRIGNREISGEENACLFLRPRPDSDVASVGVVCGSGLVGCRLTDRVPYFLAGVAFPDCTVFGPQALEKAAGGAVAAGFFGNDWSVERGEFEWAE